jgi:transposase
MASRTVSISQRERQQAIVDHGGSGSVKSLYKLRARVEQAIGKLKRFKRVAMRFEKTDTSYSAIIS